MKFDKIVGMNILTKSLLPATKPPYSSSHVNIKDYFCKTSLKMSFALKLTEKKKKSHELKLREVIFSTFFTGHC